MSSKFWCAVDGYQFVEQVFDVLQLILHFFELLILFLLLADHRVYFLAEIVVVGLIGIVALGLYSSKEGKSIVFRGLTRGGTVALDR